MATIHVDGKSYDVNGSDNLLEACLTLGLDIPYFCWHPALGSVGACRQCAVKQFNDENDTRGRLVMSCMTPANDKTYIAIKDEEARSFRKSVVEWLMTNHPHDCPVCAEGGHCHLQDMTVMTGHNTRRYRFTKRTHVNQDLGPFVNHEMNRCIACYRCVRYYDDYAGGKDFGVYGAHDNVYFGRPESGDLESEFSGNLTEVCPTGVFTDKTHADHYTRKWDMQFAPSICQNCSVGCNTSPGERYGEIRRVENRFNGVVNHYFLCDRGRFGYGFVNRADRPVTPRLAGSTESLGIDAALDKAAELLRGAKRVVGIGSPRASLETNFALASLVGAGNISYGVAAEEQALNSLVHKVLNEGGVTTPNLRDIEKADTVLVLGEDITQTAPRVALAVRQAAKTLALKMAAAKKVPEWNAYPIKNIVQTEKSPVFIASVSSTRLDDIAATTSRASAADIARLGFAVANIIDSSSPAVTGLSSEQAEQAQAIAKGLLAADKPLVISGTGLKSKAVIQAAANVAHALKVKGKDVSIALTLLESNSLGTSLLDIQGGESVEAILTAVRDGAADTLVIVENDLYERAPAELVDAALNAAKAVIVLDHMATATVAKAKLVLPAASFAEGDGTLVSMEGRAQRFFQVYDASYYKPETKIREGWRWLHAIKSTLDNKPVDWTILDDVTEQLASSNALLASITQAAPGSDIRIAGSKIAREPRRYSGRTAMRANISVHEPRQPQDQDSAMSFSMEGISGPTNNSQLIPFAWAPGWNSPQAWNKFQVEVGGSLRAGDSGVRLLEASGSAIYFTEVPSTIEGLQSAPLYHLYGSDEQSAKAEVVATRVPQAYVAVSAVDAHKLGLSDGQQAEVIAGGAVFAAPVKISADLATGVVGIPVLAGLPKVASGLAVSLKGGV
ncbi:MAG: NADH-quinone oxidoreductase subunit NuoG [Gammaproteobacteria bacterium]|nr:MAG: NADH-quinone oxidoreductase subunit NuoG [Gammaproteobacteria bacterium]